MDRFQVLVLEGSTSDDIATYYADEEPVLLSMSVENQEDIQGVFIQFIPRNGSPNRVGKTNLVPADRIIAIVEPGQILDAETLAEE
jgi:hypothetical protein